MYEEIEVTFLFVFRKYKSCSKSHIPALGGMVSLLAEITDNKELKDSLRPKKVMELSTTWEDGGTNSPPPPHR